MPGPSFQRLTYLALALSVIVLLWSRDSTRVRAMTVARFRLTLVFLSLVAVAAYTNGFQFHGAGSWLHYHDVAHYYLGSKYFDEVGYQHLYVAMLRAEQEEYGNLVTSQARDLSENHLVPSAQLLERSDDVKARFSPERWSAFRHDVRLFRDVMGPAYAEVLKDHGYNPTPVWTLIGGTLANRIPAGDARGLFALSLLDPLLLAATFLAIVVAFDADVAMLVLIYFCICFGARFDWTGGAFLRHLSFAAILLTTCALSRQYDAIAGASLAVAACLRVFPALLAAGPLSRYAAELWRGVPSRSATRFAAAFASGSAVLFSLSLLRFHGVDPWHGFAANIAVHSQSASANIIGLTNWFTFLRPFDVTTPAGFEGLIRWRETVYRLQVSILFPLAGVAVFILARRGHETLLRLFSLGALLVFAGLNLSAYYYSYLAFLIPSFRERTMALIWVFSVELCVYLLSFVEERELMLYMYKSLLLAGAFCLIYAEGAHETGGVRGKPDRMGTPLTR